MDFINMLGIFQKKTPISTKFIINRDGVVELTLGIDCSSTVACLRTILTERLSDLSEDEQFIHSNGAPIHILDEQETIISELLLENSNVIFLKTKLTKELMTAPNSTKPFQNKKSGSLPSSDLRRSQQKLIPIVDTIAIKTNSETKLVLLSDLISSTTLEVYGTQISLTDMKRIVSSLKQNKKVQKLTVRSGCHHLIEILVEVLQVNRTLTHLDISPDMNDADCILIANALINNRNLQNLTLRRNKITSAGCESIGEMLKSNRTLQHLNICRNQLRDEGIKLICKALMINETLCHLDIYQTEISINGCGLVAQMLRVNRTLTLLDVGDNNLGDNGITMIANALKENNTLIELDSKWNKISEKGALVLIDTLKTNRNLTTIKLQFNNMSHDVEIEMNKKASQLKTTGVGICSIL